MATLKRKFQSLRRDSLDSYTQNIGEESPHTPCFNRSGAIVWILTSVLMSPVRGVSRFNRSGAIVWILTAFTGDNDPYVQKFQSLRRDSLDSYSAGCQRPHRTGNSFNRSGAIVWILTNVTARRFCSSSIAFQSLRRDSLDSYHTDFGLLRWRWRCFNRSGAIVWILTRTVSTRQPAKPCFNRSGAIVWILTSAVGVDHKGCHCFNRSGAIVWILTFRAIGVKVALFGWFQSLRRDSLDSYSGGNAGMAGQSLGFNRSGAIVWILTRLHIVTSSA